MADGMKKRRKKNRTKELKNGGQNTKMIKWTKHRNNRLIGPKKKNRNQMKEINTKKILERDWSSCEISSKI